MRITAALRSPRGCPWDLKQTHETLRPFLIEEAYEALDAIDRGDMTELAGELGDVLFPMCVPRATSGRDWALRHGDICQRDRGEAHPPPPARLHIVRPLVAETRAKRLESADKVLEQWEQIKAREQGAVGAKRRVLSGIPLAMPALVRAHEIGTRVAAVGFDWPDASGIFAKIDEELAELKQALAESPEHAAEELGDVLFSVANLARKLGMESESLLRAANDKFTRRFTAIEETLEQQGTTVHETSTDDLERAWQKVKRTADVARRPASR